jgi:diguanylate cyclase (GGDEF)-like protein/putative nucleotidyltransferase with HDIG domain
MTPSTRIYIGAIIAGGMGVLAYDLSLWRPQDLLRFAFYVLITVFASGMKVKLPGVTGTMSVHFLFLLVGTVSRTLPEVLIAGTGATLVQCFWKARRRPRVIQVFFNIGSTCLAIKATDAIYHWGLLADPAIGAPVRLAAAAIVFFVTNTAPVAIVIAMTEGKSPRRVWQDCYFWCFPYYLVGASLAGLFGFLSRLLGEPTTLLILPVVYVIFRSYSLYLGKLESEKTHAQQMASLHLRTIEALALAIDAKDHTTHDHLQRVHVYALEIGRELGLGEDDLQGLQTAALLHDIGKLAVPEHIISKPGKLTPEEFEKMKIHPLVGAEILDRVQFPYPVVPIVRAHHEKWDGTGYPCGLKGEEIPLGARILSVVDCLDALASERQYRRALPLDQALAVVVSESGKSYDPRVVAILERRMPELEAKAMTGPKVAELGKLSTDVVVERGEAPAVGFQEDGTASVRAARAQDFLMSIAAARQEAQSLYELAQTLGNSLSVSETMSVMAGRVKQLVPYDALVVYVLRGEVLKPEYVVGEDSRLFSSLNIPLGQGLSGWVAENRKPIINGNPSVEPGYLNDPRLFSVLNSALALPLESGDGVVGVLTLYRSQRDAFSKDQLRVLLAITSKLSVAVENALKYDQAESSATTDYLTALPNARSLFVYLDGELARAARQDTDLAVLVCDIDGFKQVNDRFGHLAGNQVLREVATKFRSVCREYDYVARMGGDEFVLVLPRLTTRAAAHKVEELNRITVQAGIDVCGEGVVSLSVGTAFFPTDGWDAEELLAEADRRMYKNKNEKKRSHYYLHPRLDIAPALERVN